MPKGRPNKEGLKCIHCLSVPDEITDDHVIPESWYSMERSRDTRKPTAPSCPKCNNDLGALEKKVSHQMWLSMPDTNPLTPELRIKVFRAFGMGPDGKGLPSLKPRERHARLQYLKKLMNATVPAGKIDENRMMPGFSFHPGYERAIQRGTLFDPKELERVAEKIIRGVEYIQKGAKRYIEEPYRMEAYPRVDAGGPEFKAIRDICPVFYDGTNTIQRGAVPERPLEPIYIIRVWNQWEIWGVIMHKDRYFSLPESGSLI